MTIKRGKKVRPPAGYMTMLWKHPIMAVKDWRMIKTLGESDFSYSRDCILIEYTFNDVYLDFTYKSESFDVWNNIHIAEKFSGDCEDFALRCRYELLRRGINSGCLLVCKERKTNAKGHCVLIAGDYVFDCRLSKICDIDSFKDMYNLIAISSPALLGAWHEVLN